MDEGSEAARGWLRDEAGCIWTVPSDSSDARDATRGAQDGERKVERGASRARRPAQDGGKKVEFGNGGNSKGKEGFGTWACGRVGLLGATIHTHGARVVCGGP